MSDLVGGIEPYNARPLRARVKECHFGFYSSDEVRALSVLRLTSTEVSVCGTSSWSIALEECGEFV